MSDPSSPNTLMSLDALINATSALDVVFWLIGLAVIVGGFVVLREARARLQADAPPDRDSASGPALLATALALLIAGYHMIVWGLPDHLTNLKVAEESWYALFGVLAGLVMLTRYMDRLDRQTPEDEHSASGGSGRA